MDISMILAGIAIALLGSFVGSFSGGGASLIVLPLLIILSPASSYASILAVAKVNALFMTVTSSGVHYKKSKINFKLLAVITIAGLLGTALGTYLIQYQFNETLLRQLLAICLLITALFLALKKDEVSGQQKEKVVDFKVYFYSFVFCFLTAILNGMFGGGGFFVTAFLVSYLRMNFLLAAAFTMATAVIVNIFQAGYLLWTELVNWWLVIAVSIGGLIGAFLGTHLQYLKGNLWIKRVSIVMMAAIGVNMLI